MNKAGSFESQGGQGCLALLKCKASAGEPAKYICNNLVDMVFVADDMRPVNGLQLLQVLRKNSSKLAVVMLSGDERNSIDAIRAGSEKYRSMAGKGPPSGGLTMFRHAPGCRRKRLAICQDNLAPTKKGEVT